MHNVNSRSVIVISWVLKVLQFKKVLLWYLFLVDLLNFDSFSYFFGSSSFPLFLLLHGVFLFFCVCFVPAVSSDRPHPFRDHGDQVHCGGLCDHVVIDWFDCSSS